MANNTNILKSPEHYKNEFLKKRAFYAKQTFNKGSIEIEEIMADAYIEECASAAGGDLVSMDLLSNWFKHGNQVLDENIDTSMKWLFLAGANGNTHSITKLQLFFNFVYSHILSQDYIQKVAQKYDLNSENYQIMIGQMLCNVIVKDLHIDALELAKQKTSKLEHNQKTMQMFTRVISTKLDRIDEVLRSEVE